MASETVSQVQQSYSSPMMRLRLRLRPYRRYLKWLRPIARGQMRLVLNDALQWRFCRWVSMLTTDPGERILWRMPGTKLLFHLDPLETVQMCLYYRHAFQPEIGHWVRQSLCSDALFIDAGANIGLQSLIAAEFFRGNLGKTTRPMVYSLEPNPVIFAELQENVRLNDLDDLVTALPRALSDREESTAFYLSSDDNSTSSSLAALGPEHMHTGVTVDVQTITLDRLIDPGAANRRIGLIKLDIEGAEFLALRGGAKLLAQDRPAIIMEVYPDLMRSFGYVFDDARAFLESRDYTIYRILPNWRLAVMGSGEWPSNVPYGDVLCVPNGSVLTPRINQHVCAV